MNKHKCCVRKCSKTREDQVILHCFPNPDKELERFEQWTYAIGGDVLFLDKKVVFQQYRICHTHFEEKYHTRSRRLSANAVPTLLLLGWYPFKKQIKKEITVQDYYNGFQCQEIPSSQPIVSTSTQPLQYVIQPSKPSALSECSESSAMDQPMPSPSNDQSVEDSFKIKLQEIRTYTPGHREEPSKESAEVKALKNKLKRLQKANISLREKLKKSTKLSENKSFQKTMAKFSDAAKLFIMLQFREVNKNHLGRRFTKMEKVMALDLFKQGPKTYGWLSKLFVLPSPLTLSRMVARELQTDLNEDPLKMALNEDPLKMGLNEDQLSNECLNEGLE